MAGVNAAQLKKQYGSLLRNRGIKATYKRMLILWLLDNPTDKPLMPELCERLRLYIPYQQHSAVYRAVKELVGAGLLRTVVVSGKAHLDGWQQAHHNLVCRSCSVVDSIPLQSLDSQELQGLVHDQGYNLSEQGLDLEVVCPRCLS